MRFLIITSTLAIVGGLSSLTFAQTYQRDAVIDLWTQGKVAFGVFVPARAVMPGSRQGGPGSGSPVYSCDDGERLAMNALYDYVFLNLEGAYDPGAVRAIADGLRSPKAVGRKTLIVRIPPISRDGAEAARRRVKQVLDLGADGVTLPHVQSIDEAKLAIGFFREVNANIWSTTNPNGEKLAILMIEDPKALAFAKEIADLKGYSILACGIGSLRQALGGDREAAEAGTQKVLAETKRVGLVNMLTATPQDVGTRVKQGFLAVLAQGPNADEAIRLGRAAAGR